MRKDKRMLIAVGRLVKSVLSKLQVRETKVRRAGIGGRARLAGELRDMDDEVRAGSCKTLESCTVRSHKDRG